MNDPGTSDRLEYATIVGRQLEAIREAAFANLRADCRPVMAQSCGAPQGDKI